MQFCASDLSLIAWLYCTPELDRVSRRPTKAKVCVHVFLCVYFCVSVCIFVYACVNVCVYACVCIVCVCVRVYMCVCLWCACVCAYGYVIF